MIEFEADLGAQFEGGTPSLRGTSLERGLM